MLENAVARRYASAFFEIAKEQNAIEKFGEELVSAQEVLRSDEKLTKFINNQLIPSSEKKQVINNLFKGKLSDLTVNFLNLLIDKRREYYIGEIVDEFKNYTNEEKNVADALVVSAFEMNEKDLQDLKVKLSAITQKEINLNAAVDPSIKGGLIVKMGDKIIDGSLARRFEVMKQTLLQ